MIFDRAVRACAYVASTGNTGGGTPASHFVATAQRSLEVNGVFVRVRDDRGSPADGSFHLIVQC